MRGNASSSTVMESNRVLDPERAARLQPHRGQVTLTEVVDTTTVEEHGSRVWAEKPDEVLEEQQTRRTRRTDDHGGLGGAEIDGDAVEHDLGNRTSGAGSPRG